MNPQLHVSALVVACERCQKEAMSPVCFFMKECVAALKREGWIQPAGGPKWLCGECAAGIAIMAVRAWRAMMN